MRIPAFPLVSVLAVAFLTTACRDTTPAGTQALSTGVPTYSLVGARSASTSTFDADGDSWTIFGDAEGGVSASIQVYPEYDPSGGNPGGAVFADDDGRGIIWFWQAPPKFLRNQLGTYGGRLEFDLKQSALDGQQHWADVVLAGAGMTLVIDAYPVDPPTGTVFGNPGLTWTHYSIGLTDDAGWRHRNQDSGDTATAAELRAVLKDLIVLRIRGEFRNGDDRGGLDNVRLLPPGLDS